MIPQRSGTPNGSPNPIPNLVRRSWVNDTNLSIRSRASNVNSIPDPANPKRGDITKARWNKHYLVPKLNTGDDSTEPIADFTPPDWVFVTDQGPTVFTSTINDVPSSSVVGRYAYAIYDEGGLVDLNVAGYPSGTTNFQYGRKGALAFADLTAPSPYPIPNGSGGSAYQVDKIVGWRNYGTTRPSGLFPLVFLPRIF